MNRKELENRLDDVRRSMQACLAPIDEFYKKFESWIEDVDSEIQKYNAGKSIRVLVPTTPLGNCHRLSVIRESPGIGESRNHILKPSKCVAAKYKHSLKSQSKRSKRNSSTYEEEPEDQSDVDKTSEHLSRTFTGLEPCQESSETKCESVENVVVSCGSTRNVPIREGQRKNQSYDLKGRDESVPVRRITRSNAAPKTCSENSFEYGDKLLAPQTFSSVSFDESCNFVGDSASKTSLASINEGEGAPVMKRGRTKGRKTRKKTLSSVNKSNSYSQTTINEIENNREATVDTEKKSLLITKQVDNEKCVASSTKRSTRFNASKVISEIVNESAVLHHIEAQNLEAKLDVHLYQNISAPFVKVDNQVNISNTAVVSEDMLMAHKTNVEKIIKGNIHTQGNQEAIVDKDNMGNTRKRSCSNEIDNNPRKKSHLNAYSDEIVAVNEIEFQKESKYISQTRKNSTITKHNEEKHSFSQISLPASDMKECEYIFNDEETEKEVGTNKQKGKSSRGNSITNSSECCKYHSLGSKVDSDTVPDNEKQNEEVECNSVVLGQIQTIQSKRLEKSKMHSKKSPTLEIQASCKKGLRAALFSPYANEPVINRVAAYEVLSNIHEEIEIPSSTKRVTRTKTRAMAAAAAAAKNNRDLEPDNKLHQRSNGKNVMAQKLARTSVRLAKMRLNAGMKRNGFGKENSFNFSAEASTCAHSTPMTGKILSDLNGLSSSQLNLSRKTPMTPSNSSTVNSMNQLSKSTVKPGVVVTNVATFIKRPPTKTAEDPKQKRLEEIRKREEKEKEMLRRREENLKRLAEEKKKKRDEMMQRVKENREAQEKEKEIKIRIEKQKNGKWNNLQHEGEVIVKENTLKNKLETEKKAAESQRKLEEGEATRIAKKKLEEQQNRELEEVEYIQNVAGKNKAAGKREIFEKKMKEMQLCKKVKDKQNVLKGGTENLNHTSSTSGNGLSGSKVLDSTFNIPSSNAEKSNNKKEKRNVYNLKDLPSDDSDVEDESPKITAYWASKAKLLRCSKWEKYLVTLAREDCCLKVDFNMQEIFPNKRMRKRTSSAIWKTPPRFSTLPKY